eukprot:1150692-Pelagomonas_calceolata.AAC.4
MAMSAESNCGDLHSTARAHSKSSFTADGYEEQQCMQPAPKTLPGRPCMRLQVTPTHTHAHMHTHI